MTTERLTAIYERLAKLEAGLDVLAEAKNGQELVVAELRTEINEVKSSLAELETLPGRVAFLEGALGRLEGRVGAMDGKLDAVISKLVPLEPLPSAVGQLQLAILAVQEKLTWRKAVVGFVLLQVVEIVWKVVGK